MKVSVTAAFGALLICVSVTAAELPQSVVISVPEAMTANATGTAAPIELMREAYRRIGVEMRTKVVPHERMLHEAGLGDTDGILAIGPTSALGYPDLVETPEPVLELELIGLTTGLDFKVEGWQSLAPYRICIMRGAKDTERNTKGMQVEEGNSVSLVVAMLRGGRCDVAVVSTPTWRNIDELHLGHFHELSPALGTIQLRHYVHRRNAELAPLLDTALKSMRRDGTMAKLTTAETQAAEAARQRNLMPPPK